MIALDNEDQKWIIRSIISGVITALVLSFVVGKKK